MLYLRGNKAGHLVERVNMTASIESVARLTKAVQSRDVGTEMRAALLAQIEAGLSQSAVSTMIDLVEAHDLTTAAIAAANNKVTEPGYYAHPEDDRPVKVQRSKKGYLYALELDGPKPRFVSGLLTQLDCTRKIEKPVVTADKAAGQLSDLLAQLGARTG